MKKQMSMSKIFLLCLLTNFVSGTTSEDMRNLEAFLFANYSATLRPSKNYSEPTIVQMKVAITDLIELNEVQRYMKVFCIFTLAWRDDFLVWKPKDRGGITKMQIESHDIWKPYLSLYSSLDEMDMFGDGRYRLTVYSDGSVKWKPSLKVSVVCNINVEKFPFDTQTCNLTFSPLHYTKEEVQLAIMNYREINDYTGKPQSGWELEKPAYFAETSRSGDDHISIMKVAVKLKRQYEFFLLNFSIPIIILSFLNLLTFWLPNDSGEKVSFSTTVLLSLTVFLTNVGSTLPKNGEKLVLIVTYIAILLVLSCLTVLTTIVLLFFHHKKKIRQERRREASVDLTQDETKWMKMARKMKYAWRKFLCKSDYDSKSGCTIDMFLFLLFLAAWISLNVWFFALSLYKDDLNINLTVFDSISE